MGAAHLDAAVAADVELVARLDAHHAQVLDRGLRTIARTAENGELALVRVPRTPRHSLDLDPETRRVLRAESAPFPADAGFDGAQRLAVRVPGDESGGAQVAPNLRQVFFLDAEKMEPLSARELDRRHAVLLRDFRDRAKLFGRRDAAPDARHDRIRAVALNVAVRPLVDEPRLLVVDV